MSSPELPNAVPLPLRLARALLAKFRRPRGADLKMLALLALVVTVFTVAALWLMSTAAHAVPLSAGDRLQVVVEAGEDFTGKYQLDVGGQVQLAYAGPVVLAGLEPEAAGAAISDRLVSTGIFKRGFVRTAVQVLAWAPVEVRVSGEVFYPGAHRINMAPTRDRAPDRSEEVPGAALPERRLSDALRAAGGVTPWADIAHIALRRGGRTRSVDLWGLLRGEPGDDPAMQSGDEVLVSRLELAQPALARPSAITPPGIKIFVSNLIQPALSNAQATASGGAISLAYGARFSQAVVAANCVGGTSIASSRSAVLVRTDRISGTTRHWDAPVEQLMRAATDDINPLLLESDAVACYDSTVVSAREVFHAVYEMLVPFAVLKSLR